MSFITFPQASPAPALAPLYELEPPPATSPRRRQLQNALYRHRWLGLALFAACVGLAVGASWWVRPYYEATGTLIIAHPSLHATELTPADYTPPVDPDREMQTELTILGSRAVAAQVIASLELERRDPEIRRVLAAAAHGAARKGRDLSPLQQAETAAEVFAAKLKLAPNKLSSTVEVRYGSHDPQLAAQVVNATAAAFMQQTLAARTEEGDQSTPWMRQQVASAEQELQRDDAAVADFQQQHSYIPLLDTGGAQSGLLDRLADANHAYSAAEAERIADEATARSFAGATGGVVAELPAELRDPAIDRAADNVGAAQEQLTTLETTYQPNFPLVVEARQQLAGAQQKLAGLRAQVQAGLDQRLGSSRQREQELAELVAALSQQAAAASGVEMQFGVLKARADSQRALVATLRQKLGELELASSLPPSHIQMLDAALPPNAPAYPSLPTDLGLGLGLGLTLALGTALARERWGGTLTAAEAVKHGLGPALAPLGMIAEQRRTRARGLLPSTTGQGATAYQKAAANLVARCGAPPRAILVTSPNPGEGKTTSLCQLGLALAQGGWRTLVVDADRRHPSCHAFFGMTNTTGLAAAEAGRKVAPQVVAPHLDLVPCEDDAAQPLQARAMATLLEQWREHYDYILLDSPPGNVAGEAVLLAALVEGVVVVLRWGRTRLAAAQQLCEELARARAPLLGTLFNRADPGAPAFRAYRAAARPN